MDDLRQGAEASRPCGRRLRLGDCRRCGEVYLVREEGPWAMGYCSFACWYEARLPRPGDVVAGGQGRDAEDVVSSGLWFGLAVAVFLTAIAGLVLWELLS